MANTLGLERERERELGGVLPFSKNTFFLLPCDRRPTSVLRGTKEFSLSQTLRFWAEEGGLFSISFSAAVL